MTDYLVNTYLLVFNLKSLMVVENYILKLGVGSARIELAIFAMSRQRHNP